jgi:8-oxo-dGTP pyrophosphatase MutT (NUDIX family)
MAPSPSASGEIRVRTPGRSEILARLARHTARREPAPDENPASQAAVAMILHAPRADSAPELLFIERARHPEDPWSGQMAFPGGRMESGDPDLSVTAARETLEEVGVKLAHSVGRLDDLSNARMRRRQPGVRAVTVSPFVYLLEERPALVHNHEVASTVWIPLEHILHPRAISAYRMDLPRFQGTFPAFVYERYQVWGLTYRIVESFAGLFDLVLPASRVHSERNDSSDGR